MEHEPRRVTFTLKNLLALTLIISVLLALAMPAIQSAREAARRNQCASHVKIIGLGLQNHHDFFKRFPPVSGQGDPAGSASIWQTAPGATFVPGRPAPNGYSTAPASAAGYSWLVMILPYLEEHELFDDLVAASDGLRYEAFSTSGVDGKPFALTGGTGGHFATVPLDLFRCPSLRGDGISTASSGTATPPVAISAYAKLFQASPLSASGVAVSSYFALSATHLACMALGRFDPETDDVEPPNGVIVPEKGLNMIGVLDGTSRTLIVCETREPAVNSWYDGTVCWTVGANPNASNQPTRSTSAINMQGLANTSGRWIFPQGTTDAGGLNFGPGASGKPLFAPHGTTIAQTQPVSWGPSSFHADGVVLHLACDASVHAIKSDIDPALYLELITRAGREPVTICDCDGDER